MADLDYGAIVKKNGVFIDEPYLGDDELNIELHRTRIIIRSNGEIVKTVYETDDMDLPYNRYRLKFEVNGIEFDVKRLGKSQFKLRFIYKDNTYVCVYGYAVGEEVSKWWRAWGCSKKEYEYPLKWYKYIQ